MIKPLCKLPVELSGNVKIQCFVDTSNIVKDDREDVIDENNFWGTVRYARLVPALSNDRYSNITCNLLTSDYSKDISNYYEKYISDFFDIPVPFDKDTIVPVGDTAKSNFFTDFSWGCKRCSYRKNFDKQHIFFAPLWTDGEMPDAFELRFTLRYNKNVRKKTITIPLDKKFYKEHVENNIDAFYAIYKGDTYVKPEKNTYTYLPEYLDKYSKQMDGRVINMQPAKSTSYIFGIDLRNGCISTGESNILKKIWRYYLPVNNFDYTITSAFKEAGYVAKQILPLSFAFNIDDILGNSEKRYADISVDGHYVKDGYKLPLYDIDTNYNDFGYDYTAFDDRSTVDPNVTDIHRLTTRNTVKNDNYYIFKGKQLQESFNEKYITEGYLKEALVTQYIAANKYYPYYFKWKLSGSDDEVPYIVNANLEYNIDNEYYNSFQFSNFTNRMYPSFHIRSEERNGEEKTTLLPNYGTPNNKYKMLGYQNHWFEQPYYYDRYDTDNIYADENGVLRVLNDDIGPVKKVSENGYVMYNGLYMRIPDENVDGVRIEIDFKQIKNPTKVYAKLKGNKNKFDNKKIYTTSPDDESYLTEEAYCIEIADPSNVRDDFEQPELDTFGVADDFFAVRNVKFAKHGETIPSGAEKVYVHINFLNDIDLVTFIQNMYEIYNIYKLTSDKGKYVFEKVRDDERYNAVSNKPIYVIEGYIEKAKDKINIDDIDNVRKLGTVDFVTDPEFENVSIKHEKTAAPVYKPGRTIGETYIDEQEFANLMVPLLIDEYGMSVERLNKLRDIINAIKIPAKPYRDKKNSAGHRYVPLNTIVKETKHGATDIEKLIDPTLTDELSRAVPGISKCILLHTVRRLYNPLFKQGTDILDVYGENNKIPKDFGFYSYIVDYVRFEYKGKTYIVEKYLLSKLLRNPGTFGTLVAPYEETDTFVLRNELLGDAGTKRWLDYKYYNGRKMIPVRVGDDKYVQLSPDVICDDKETLYYSPNAIRLADLDFETRTGESFGRERRANFLRDIVVPSIVSGKLKCTFWTDYNNEEYVKYYALPVEDVRTEPEYTIKSKFEQQSNTHIDQERFFKHVAVEDKTHVLQLSNTIYTDILPYWYDKSYIKAPFIVKQIDPDDAAKYPGKKFYNIVKLPSYKYREITVPSQQKEGKNDLLIRYNIFVNGKMRILYNDDESKRYNIVRPLLGYNYGSFLAYMTNKSSINKGRDYNKLLCDYLWPEGSKHIEHIRDAYAMLTLNHLDLFKSLPQIVHEQRYRLIHNLETRYSYSANEYSIFKKKHAQQYITVKRHFGFSEPLMRKAVGDVYVFGRMKKRVLEKSYNLQLFENKANNEIDDYRRAAGLKRFDKYVPGTLYRGNDAHYEYFYDETDNVSRRKIYENKWFNDSKILNLPERIEIETGKITETEVRTKENESFEHFKTYMYGFGPQYYDDDFVRYIYGRYTIKYDKNPCGKTDDGTQIYRFKFIFNLA